MKMKLKLLRQSANYFIIIILPQSNLYLYYSHEKRKTGHRY